jgi:hypothetical protein
MAATPLVHRLMEQIRSWNADVFPSPARTQLEDMLERDLRRRHEAANHRDAAAWAQIASRDEWERFLAPRLEALRASLGRFPAPPAELRTWTAGSVEGDRFRIEKVLFESRPGVVVTANLYLPSPRRDRMPVLLIVHSHHNAKAQGELQDMGRHGRGKAAWCL